jgi:hypothetical protein
MPKTGLCPHGFREMKAKVPTAAGKNLQMNNRSRVGRTSVVSQNLHPASFALDSVESRAAARILAESRESFPYQCAACFLSGLPVMGASEPDFIPSEGMKKGPHGWEHGCSKHKDPSREAAVQEMIKSGQLGGPKL